MNIEKMNSGLLVAKYGGSSTANAEALTCVIYAMEANPSQRVIIFSAPGRDESHPDKVTDLLLQRRLGEFEDRMYEIGRDMGWRQRDVVMRGAMRDLRESSSPEFDASRGEYTITRLMADVTGSQFIDARRVVKIGTDLNGARYIAGVNGDLIQQSLDRSGSRVMIPGFYGENEAGQIAILSRDGSDTTGAAVARALRAGVYQIFSDTAVRTADPRKDPTASVVSEMTFHQLGELTATGAKVVHPQVVEILRGTGTSINCLNTFAPRELGTWISD